VDDPARIVQYIDYVTVPSSPHSVSCPYLCALTQCPVHISVPSLSVLSISRCPHSPSDDFKADESYVSITGGSASPSPDRAVTRESFAVHCGLVGQHGQQPLHRLRSFEIFTRDLVIKAVSTKSASGPTTLGLASTAPSFPPCGLTDAVIGTSWLACLSSSSAFAGLVNDRLRFRFFWLLSPWVVDPDRDGSLPTGATKCYRHFIRL
jgi:hypothetical protein